MIGGILGRRHITIVVPWLMGGGAQAALLGVLRQVRNCQITLVILFKGSENFDELRQVVNNVVEIGAPKSPTGVLSAARQVQPYLLNADSVYSLMRASHVVLGVRPKNLGNGGRRFAASFHQLPSADGTGLVGTLENRVLRRATRRASLITAPSHRAVEEIAIKGFAAREVVRYEPNVVAPRAAPPVPPREGELAEIRLFFAGRLTTQKGLDRIPALLKGVDRPVHLLIAGEGPERRRLEGLMAGVNHPHRVEFLGYTEDIEGFMDWCDVLVMPSREELNPVSLWEARLAGRPTIGSNIPAFVDLAQEGGVLTFSDQTEFADAIRYVAMSSRWRFSTAQDLIGLGRSAATSSLSALVRVLEGTDAR